MRRAITSRKVFVILATIIGLPAFSAGLEQELMWSGKYVGMASANTAFVSGPEALYFNPAGLFPNGDHKNEMVFDVSYLPAKFRAPLTADNDEVSSQQTNGYAGAILYSRQLNESWAFGVGIFPVGGDSIKYDEADFGGGVKGSAKTELEIIEFSPAIAYRASEHLSFGLGYRVTYVRANYTLTSVAPAVLEFKDLQGWDFFAFRLGAQYKTDNWGLGMNFRTPVKFHAKGKMDGNVGVPISADPATLSTTFPLAINLGSYYKFSQHFKMLFDYDFLNYSQTDKLQIDAADQVPDQNLAWYDGHLFRLGAEYVFTKLALRAGTIFETSITNKSTASPQTEVPGVGYFFTAGAGYAFTDAIEANLAAHYGFSSDNVQGDASTGVLAGKYSAVGYGVHAGLNWGF